MGVYKAEIYHLKFICAQVLSNSFKYTRIARKLAFKLREVSKMIGRKKVLIEVLFYLRQDKDWYHFLDFRGLTFRPVLKHASFSCFFVWVTDYIVCYNFSPNSWCTTWDFVNLPIHIVNAWRNLYNKQRSKMTFS